MLYARVRARNLMPVILVSENTHPSRWAARMMGDKLSSHALRKSPKKRAAERRLQREESGNVSGSTRVHGRRAGGIRIRHCAKLRTKIGWPPQGACHRLAAEPVDARGDRRRPCARDDGGLQQPRHVRSARKA